MINVITECNNSLEEHFTFGSYKELFDFMENFFLEYGSQFILNVYLDSFSDSKNFVED